MTQASLSPGPLQAERWEEGEHKKMDIRPKSPIPTSPLLMLSFRKTITARNLIDSPSMAVEGRILCPLEIPFQLFTLPS